ncbi:Asp-tRNA(Asn)/Glu-tRNA(Gln) amidotransferase subunit GatC [Rothia kristinae]|uniref:Asp-tRNA(Asn)/Glu-tRNA(Gln) amidotransferase subunit GatC n=1 Tax=Rothia kristinae TaxID=37923 RepID=UPI00092BFC25|nr:Asp-tRNA(Asn)/Glu-tRNA(Gln) amidotransferase subunit GatC [Rothia kristinae]MCA1170207.1 Asp-tRNA(Asn)/Glu-tRNA(Gln) amidotransferase subunit GatC [Rothia kristinae]WGH08879.1 Asp-tRNA(Asn)/Glu-tRNA(Gln) amidotransferase subunit GatC [Rothia kristinae]SIM84881.1 glutamyl-tRNA(Gln) and/or aspartyl-tRNA(Asn) amidotransferase subunit C [Mycobacteroides abscessus subsp. abscessus]
MSAITREQVAHLAELARIDMTDEELDAMSRELEVIVESVQSVSEIAQEDVAPTAHPIALANVLREDVVGPTLTQEEALSGAPDAEDGQFKVPAILGEE